MIYGVVGATVAIIATFTKTDPVPRFESRYSLDAPQLFLKIPAGAITAVVGVVLLQEVISWRPANDVQVFAVAVVLGYSQQLLTGFIDREAVQLVREARPSDAQVEDDRRQLDRFS